MWRIYAAENIKNEIPNFDWEIYRTNGMPTENRRTSIQTKATDMWTQMKKRIQNQGPRFSGSWLNYQWEYVVYNTYIAYYVTCYVTICKPYEDSELGEGRKNSLSSNNLILEDSYDQPKIDEFYPTPKNKSTEVPFMTNGQHLALKFIRIIQFRVARRKFKEALR